MNKTHSNVIDQIVQDSDARKSRLAAALKAAAALVGDERNELLAELARQAYGREEGESEARTRQEGTLRQAVTAVFGDGKPHSVLDVYFALVSHMPDVKKKSVRNVFTWLREAKVITPAGVDSEGNALFRLVEDADRPDPEGPSQS